MASVHLSNVAAAQQVFGRSIFLIIAYMSSRSIAADATTISLKAGVPPFAGSSNGGAEHPCWHTSLLAKCSVLYLL